ncbi:hypothetical protein Acr_06g0008530 [Actinidia rufa]|uniref:Uncharacterized protein n=1 Tax=Actinidia rufa TaxID=165716 RepID=A0A7J0ER52_9ERIC|nr:hypothetical protein Acr_06g0008530 [Actinidia rufa]
MSIRECLRANGQRESPSPPLDLGWYNQSNPGMGYESTYSQYHFESNSYQEPFDYYHAPPPPYQTPPCEYPQAQFLPYDAYHIPHNSTQEDTIKDTLEDTIQLAIKFQEEVNSRVNESFNEIQSQLTLLMQTLVVQAEDKSFLPSPLILTRLGCLSEPTHPITNLRIEDTIDQITFSQDFESKEDVPKVSEEIIENEPWDEECEREESEIGDSKQEEKDSTEITLDDDFGLLDVGNVQVKKDVNGLEAISTFPRDHEIPTFEPLTPSPNLPEPLELHVPTLELGIIPMADQQKEGEGQSLYDMSIIGTFMHDNSLFSTYQDFFYPYVLSCYIIEFIKEEVIAYSCVCTNSLKISSLGVWV